MNRNLVKADAAHTKKKYSAPSLKKLGIGDATRSGNGTGLETVFQPNKKTPPPS